MDYVRFPRTPHLVWLGPGQARDDKVLSPQDAADFLSHPVIVEEKIDGANLGISVGPGGELKLQNRGSFLSLDALQTQFKPLPRWLGLHRLALAEHLDPELILFGEWCYATHSVHYTRLPDWFVAFDVFDRTAEKFWSVERRNVLAAKVGVPTVPEVARGTFDLKAVTALLGRSRFTDGPAEGVYLRWERDGYLEQRAKLVRAEFTQAIAEHWSKTAVRPNGLQDSGSGQ